MRMSSGGRGHIQDYFINQHKAEEQHLRTQLDHLRTEFNEYRLQTSSNIEFLHNTLNVQKETISVLVNAIELLKH